MMIMSEVRRKPLFTKKGIILHLIVFLAVSISLYFSKVYNYLLFHTIAELFSIAIGYGLFMVAWHSRKYNKSKYLLFLGIAYFFIANLDLIHTLAYKNMNIFEDLDPNHSVQLWIAARFIESISILLIFLFFKKRFNTRLIFIAYLLVCSTLVVLIFSGFFPDCFIEGKENGLTLFKIISEYVISAFLLVSTILLIKNRLRFHKKVFYLLLFSFIFTIVSEIFFTLYKDVFGIYNYLGHMFKIFSFYLIYKAIIETGLRFPFHLLFKEIREKNAHLKSSEKRYRMLFENAPVGICITTMDGKIITKNAKLCAYLKSPYNGLNDKKISDFWIEKESFESLVISIQTDGFVNDLEAKLKKTDDSLFFASLNAIIVVLNDQKHILMMIKDITQQKLSEQALVEKDERLEKANSHLKELNERKNKLLGMAAHDLRNPIGVIQMYSQFLLKNIKKKINNTELHFLNTIFRTSTKMSDLIDEVLDLSKIEAGELHLQIEESDFIAMLKDIVELNKVLAGQKQINLKLLVDCELPLFPFDKNKIEQVLNNLITNAIKYSYPNTEILIKAMGLKEEMMISVIDQGQGIPEEEMVNLFLAFERTSVKPTGGEQSTGLGLAIAKKIIEGHHGHIGVESEPGKGSTFYFTIPMKPGQV